MTFTTHNSFAIISLGTRGKTNFRAASCTFPGNNLLNPNIWVSSDVGIGIVVGEERSQQNVNLIYLRETLIYFPK